MRTETNISFIEDVAKEVAKEFEGITEEDVMQVYINTVRWIKHLMVQDNVFAIIIPYIGIMHINKGFLKRVIQQQEAALSRGQDVDRDKYDRSKKKLAVIVDFQKKRKESKAKGGTTHNKKSILGMLYTKTKINLEGIEKIQKDYTNGKNK